MTAPRGHGSGRRKACLLLLLGAAGAAACFAAVATAVRQPRTQAFDEWALRSLRSGEDPSRPVGPAWVEPAAKAVTFLGSFLGAALAAVAAASFLRRGGDVLRGEGVPPLRPGGILRGEGVSPLRPEGILPSAVSSSSSAAAAETPVGRREGVEEATEETRGQDARGTQGQAALATPDALAMHSAPATICLLAASLVGSVVLSEILKRAFDRPRPTAVPLLAQVPPHSFPSGHAMLAAAVYFTIALLLLRGRARWAWRAGALLAAALITGLVGASRVVLGVHYPTDVLAGWAGGLAWALICSAAALHWPRGRGQPG